MSEVSPKIIIALLVLSIMSLLANVGFLIYSTRPNVTVQLIQPVANEGKVPAVTPEEFE